MGSMKKQASAADLSYWRVRLGGVEELRLPVDRERPSRPQGSGGVVRFEADAAEVRGLKELARRHGATLFMVLLAAYKVLLMRHSGQEDIAVGTPTGARPHEELEGLIGYFVNMVVLRTDLSGKPRFSELLERVKSGALQAYEHQDLSFDRLVTELSPQRRIGHNPLYQVVFDLQNAPQGELNLQGVSVERMAVHTGKAQFDLGLSLTEVQGELRGEFEYSRELFEEETVRRLSEHYGELLRAIVSDEEQAIDRLPLLGAAEKALLLQGWEGRRQPNEVQRLHELFERQAERTPQALAVLSTQEGQGSWSYAELNDRANALAHHLIGLGVGREALVGVCMQRSMHTVVALLGIAKAGGAYLPLDPSYPEERLAFMLEDSAARWVLVDREAREAMRTWGAGATGVEVLCLEEEPLQALWSGPVKGNPCVGVEPKDLAYVIYTSGSTGRPKGVQVLHEGISNHVQWFGRTVGLQARDRMLFKTSISFDPALVEMLVPLHVGAAVVVLQAGEERDSASVIEAIGEHGVTVLQVVPSALKAMLAEPDLKGCESLRYVVCGGEALERSLASEVVRKLKVRIGNFYGPTETSIDATCLPEVDISGVGATVPIGRPVDNMHCYVLDGYGEPVPIGVIGELYVGGVGVARGYLNRPELTAERFVADPFREGGRLYRTGDLARWRAEGTLEFMGRVDHQVKLRGFRIELDEIQCALNECPGVRESVVLARSYAANDERLVAYLVTADPAAPPAIADLRIQLEKKLPRYMIPTAFAFIDSFPLTANGKLDRTALPEPQAADREAAYAAPRDDAERRMVAIWEEVLSMSPIGIDDDFFDLGGHSLMALKLLASVERQFHQPLRLASIIEAPTVRQLTQLLARATSAPPETCVVPIQAEGDELPLFFVSGYGSSLLVFNALSKALGASQPLFVLDPMAFDPVALEHWSFGDMAQRMLDDLRRVQPAGPYRLAGHSMGGVFVYELAQRLHAAGERVEQLVLLDTVGPGFPGRHPWPVRLKLYVKRAATLGPSGMARYVRWFFTTIFKRSGHDLLENLGTLAETRIGKAQKRSAAIVYDASEAYEPTLYSGSLTLVRSTQDKLKIGEIDDPYMGWRPLVRGEIHRESMDCIHKEMLDADHADVLAALLVKTRLQGL
jgi:amino acid adenylation domain-containing protein